jgi:hypothetical protein
MDRLSYLHPERCASLYGMARAHTVPQPQMPRHVFVCWLAAAVRSLHVSTAATGLLLLWQLHHAHRF